MKRLCVFCGSATGGNPIYKETAQYFGQLIAERNIELVFGGGHIGLMGVIADSVLQNGGKVIGVIPQSLKEKEVAHLGLTELYVVETMHQRKALMADLADGFVALPGGYGTGDELFEIITWAQLKIHSKPIGLLNIAGYFDGLVQWINHMVAEGFVKEKYRSLVFIHEDGDELLSQIMAN